MPDGYEVPKALFQSLVEDFGKNINAWPEELRDLVDSSITARTMSPPISGRVETILNTDFYYHWAEDRNGQNPFHERVESLKWSGWDFATTDDVQMCSEDCVIGRNEKQKSKDGKGFSNEIRSGDRRLMKLPMIKWRQHRKSQIIAAYQLAYPQPFNKEGQPMSARNLIPGMKSEQMDPDQITNERRKATPSNSTFAQNAQQ